MNRKQKKMLIIGDVEVGGERGRIQHRSGCNVSLTSTDYKDPAKEVRRWKTEE